MRVPEPQLSVETAFRARVLITGATGMLGRRLLARHAAPVVLTRDPERARALGASVEVHRWLPEAETAPLEALRGVSTVFHLAGEPVAEGRWNPEKKRRIRESRVSGTRNLVAAMAALSTPPAVLVSASAVGIYGDRGDEVLDETSAAGRGFLAEVCEAWESEAMEAEKLGVRVVCVRIGVVLGSGGALAQMLTPFRLGAGGRLGSGTQWMPWVHEDDVVGILLHAGSRRSVHGPVNAVSPNPVTNVEFTASLGRALHRPALLAVPKAALRVAFGEVSEVLLASQRVMPRVALASGYEFVHPELSAALFSVVGAGQRGVAAA